MSDEAPPAVLTAAIDVVGNAVCFEDLLGYMKATYKKEIIQLNASDFYDNAIKTMKVDGKINQKAKDDAVSSIIHLIHSKIETDRPKLIEIKRKHAQNRQKSRPSHEEDVQPEQKPFNGIVDFLYLIINFPYLPQQLESLTHDGFELNAFVSIVPPGAHQVAPYQHGPQPHQTQSKKAPIPGCNLDFSQNPAAYPPARWSALRPNAPASTSFIEVISGQTVEETFHNLETGLSRVFRSQNIYRTFVSDRKFVEIPEAIIPKDMGTLTTYLSSFPSDIVGAIVAQLKSKPKRTSHRTVRDKHESIFNRDNEPASPVMPMFPIIRKTLPFIAQVSNWKQRKENSQQCEDMCDFLSDYSAFFAFSGQKFDSIFSAINKKFKLRLPNSYFDWQLWNRSAEIHSAYDEIMPLVRDSTVFSAAFDESIGMLWLLCVPLISRVIGSSFPIDFIPPTMDGISDYLSYIFESETKLPSKGEIYRLPYSYNSSIQSFTPYFFDSTLRVEVSKTKIGPKDVFGYMASYKDDFEAVSTEDSINLSITDGVRIQAEGDRTITLLFNDKSIRFSENDLTLKASGHPSTIITNDGSMAASVNDAMVVVRSDGTIGRFEDGKWVYRGPTEGMKLSNIADGSTSFIRSDCFEYLLRKDGSRKISLRFDVIVDQGKTRRFELPGFPAISQSSEETEIRFKQFKFGFNKDGGYLKCDSYEIRVNPNGEVDFKSVDCQMHLGSGEGQFKSKDEILIANPKGETLGKMGSGKKKMDSRWGSFLPGKPLIGEAQILDLLAKYPPRFFAIRQDLSATEFFRSDRGEFIGGLSKNEVSGVNVVTSFSTQRGFVEYQKSDKADRNRVLQGLPKPKSGGNTEKAAEKLRALGGRFKDLSNVLSIEANRASAIHAEEMHPKRGALQLKLPLPPSTPSPRILEMQYEIHCPSIQKQLSEGSVSYWDSPEATPATEVIESNHATHPLSPRTRLFDPPRFPMSPKDLPSDFVLAPLAQCQQRRRCKSSSLSRSETGKCF